MPEFDSWIAIAFRACFYYYRSLCQCLQMKIENTSNQNTLYDTICTYSPVRLGVSFQSISLIALPVTTETLPVTASSDLVITNLFEIEASTRLDSSNVVAIRFKAVHNSQLFLLMKTQGILLIFSVAFR